MLLAHPPHGTTARAAAAQAVVARADARPSGHQVPQIGLVTVRPRRGESQAALARRLRADPSVASVQVEHRFTLRAVPNDPAMTTQEPAPAAPTGTAIEWWAAREDLPAAWDVTQGDGALVAVIDTGLDAGHPEFQGRIAGGIDLDDDPSDPGPATSDQTGHGTHVSSLACATANNGIGLAGAGYHCSLLMIKSDLTESSVAGAIVQATDHDADAINMSFGTDGSTPAADSIVKAIDYAYAHNVVMVAAAADDAVTEQGDPANVLQPAGTGPDITAGKGLDVTAANFADQRASFAGRGTEISMAAYGTFGQSGGPPGIFGAFPGNVTSLDTGDANGPPCHCRTIFGGDDRYAYVQGTSMSAPMVTAVAALMRHLNPSLTAGDIVKLLKQTARRPAGTGWSPDLGWGILDAGAAVDAARGMDRTPPVSRLRAPSVVHGGHRFTLRWTGSDPSPPGVIASGIKEFDVYVATHGHRAHRIARTKKTKLRFRGRPGTTYTFSVVAVDKAGNREAKHHRPDARVRVVRR